MNNLFVSCLIITYEESKVTHNYILIFSSKVMRVKWDWNIQALTRFIRHMLLYTINKHVSFLYPNYYQLYLIEEK